MATLEASGTQAATVGTEHTLATLAVSKALQAVVDISALAAGEHVQILAKTKTLAGGVTRSALGGVFSWREALIEPIVLIEPSLSDQEYVLTLKQLDGAGKSFPWKVLSP